MSVSVPDVTGLVTNTSFNTKIREVKDQTPDVRGLVTNTALNTKIKDVKNKITDHDEYITTGESDKFSD